MSGRRSAAQRTLDAEARAVEEGHYARRLGGGGKRFVVKSDTWDRDYRVGVSLVGSVVVFVCDHSVAVYGGEPERTFVPCKHGAVAARRLEREGLLRWDAGQWVPTEQALTHVVEIVDKEHGAAGNFDLSCCCGWATCLATFKRENADQTADAHVAAYDRRRDDGDPFAGLPS